MMELGRASHRVSLSRCNFSRCEVRTRGAEFRTIAADETLGKTRSCLSTSRGRNAEKIAPEMHSHAELDRVAAHIAARKLYAAIQGGDALHKLIRQYRGSPLSRTGAARNPENPGGAERHARPTEYDSIFMTIFKLTF